MGVTPNHCIFVGVSRFLPQKPSISQPPEAKTCSLEECVKVNPLEKVTVSCLQWAFWGLVNLVNLALGCVHCFFLFQDSKP